jgi:hypothetical protein
VKLSPILLALTLKSKPLKLPEETIREEKESLESPEERRVREKKENLNNKINKRRKHNLLLSKSPSNKKLKRSPLPSVREEEEEVVKVNNDQLF